MPAKQFTLRVSEPTTLIDFLVAKLQGQSRNSIKQLISHKCVWLGDKRPLQANAQLQIGDVVAVRSQKEQHKELNHPLLRIVFEDDAIMIVHKREGLLSIATDRERERTAYHILTEHVQRFDKRRKIYVVHRLDRETSGVMVFAKSPEAQERLRANWNETVIERAYIAVVHGQMQRRQGTITTYLYEDKYTYVHSSPTPIEGGLLSTTHYKVLTTNGRFSLLRLDLETGRTNQIRVHMASLGHAVLGDTKYGPDPSPQCRMMLHAQTLCIVHPLTGREVSFEMPLPREFQMCVKR